MCTIGQICPYFVHINRHSPFRSGNAKTKEEIDELTLTKVNMYCTYVHMYMCLFRVHISFRPLLLCEYVLVISVYSKCLQHSHLY